MGHFMELLQQNGHNNSAIALTSSKPFPCSAYISFDKFKKYNFILSICKQWPYRIAETELHETVSAENPLQGCGWFSNKVMTWMLHLYQLIWNYGG